MMGEPGYEFPSAIRKLKMADIPFRGCSAYMVQGENEQVLFMTFAEDVDVPEHAHEAQWATVLSGSIEMTIGGEKKEFSKGDSYYIPKGTVHGARIKAGYSDVTFFDQKDRYRAYARIDKH